MRVQKFRVTNFKSIHDSGWIDCQDVTTLVGVNEAGKSNLILALWKLNPARDGEMDILHDMPTSELSELRDKPETVPFVTAVFSVTQDDVERLEYEYDCTIRGLVEFTVTRYFDGHKTFDWTSEATFQRVAALDESEEEGESEGEQPVEDLSEKEINTMLGAEMPAFVYYSNYGNLSSRVYLPHAKKWLNGEEVQGVSLKEDQARTLKVLFEYLKLKPDEIIKLGKDPEDISKISRNSTTPTAAEVKQAEDNKEKRTMLLNAASAQLTQKFKDWWRQGEYIFRLSADGDYFTIWVKDDKRDTEIDLADRSTGLQWFLSFFLVFLVEAHGDNENAVLLLDEAGLSLHPKAQHDLLLFFEGLSKENQVIHTTHSPFLIDADNVDRCVAVYIDKDGGTKASNNLRDGSGSLEKNSVYAVHAALGLSVSDVLLSGCYPVIVEGPSDQYVLSAITQRLISEGKIKPRKETVFLPAGGNKGIAAIAGILGMRDELPPVLLDGDRPGQESSKNLRKSLYKESPERVLLLTDYLDIKEAEIEDLMPLNLIERYINRLFNDVEDEIFSDVYDDKKAIVPQIEAFATTHNILLQNGEWKVNLAKSFKAQLQKGIAIADDTLDLWTTVFNALMVGQ